jgi:hypothetical protein
MDCPECGAAALVFPVEQAYREYLPGDEPGAAICRRCLTLHPASDPSDEIPDFTAISDAFPSNDDAAVPMALMVGLLSSLALYRQEISVLLERVERAGADPLLVVDRLADDPALEPATDLRGRRRQLAQLL